jgi:hypothetical protein
MPKTSAILSSADVNWPFVGAIAWKSGFQLLMDWFKEWEIDSLLKTSYVLFFSFSNLSCPINSLVFQWKENIQRILPIVLSIL